MKIQIRRTRIRKRFYLRLVARNGEVLAHSEVYNDFRDADHAAALIAGADWTIEDQT